MLLRYDGIYCRIEEEQSHLVRFYEDGTVIAQTIQGNIEEGIGSCFPSGEWFGKDHNTKGQFRLDEYCDTEGDIEFSVTDDHGIVTEFYGTALKGGVTLSSHYHGDHTKKYDLRHFFYSDDVIEYIKANSN